MLHITAVHAQPVDNPVDNPIDTSIDTERWDDTDVAEDVGDIDADAGFAGFDAGADTDFDDDVTEDLLEDDVIPTTGADIADAALAGARHNAHNRPGRRSDRETRRRIRRENLAGRDPGSSGRNSAGYSGPGADPARDPHLLGGLLGNFVADQGWERPLAEARVFADWAQLVGSDIAAHATPQSLTAGELRIAAESTAWATQLRLLSSRVLARLVAELGPEVVTKLIITGPAAPSWKHGGRSVRGHRGPRDTYG